MKKREKLKQISKKKNSKKEINKEKIREEIKKLKVKILEIKKPEEKKKEEPKQDETSLEKEIEQSEDIIEDTEFHEFFRPSERSFTTLLDKIEIPAENLEENVALTPVQKDTNQIKEDDIVKYSMNQDYSSGENRKYKDTAMTLRHVEVDNSQVIPTQELFNPTNWTRDNSWNRQEKADIHVVDERRRLPFEREDRKYRKV